MKPKILGDVHASIYSNDVLKLFTEGASTTLAGSELQLSITRMLKLLARTFSRERLLNSFNGCARMALKVAI